MMSVARTFSEPSAEMPKLSRRSMAGSSARSFLTVSTFCELSQRGMLASLCLHRSGWSVFMHSSHTSVIEMVSKTLWPKSSTSSCKYSVRWVRVYRTCDQTMDAPSSWYSDSRCPEWSRCRAAQTAACSEVELLPLKPIPGRSTPPAPKQEYRLRTRLQSGNLI